MIGSPNSATPPEPSRTRHTPSCTLPAVSAPRRGSAVYHAAYPSTGGDRTGERGVDRPCRVPATMRPKNGADQQRRRNRSSKVARRFSVDNPSIVFLAAYIFPKRSLRPASIRPRETEHAEAPGIQQCGYPRHGEQPADDDRRIHALPSQQTGKDHYQLHGAEQQQRPRCPPSRRRMRRRRPRRRTTAPLQNASRLRRANIRSACEPKGAR